MRVVALISGGKDSCYNMMQCVASGHEIVALANLRPHSLTEIDSYMYQSVGHEAIEYVAEAMGVPLYRDDTLGKTEQQGKTYEPVENDEVEDLYKILERVKSEENIEAVSSGAILSDYQRVRVENVCVRLGLVSLCYLWQRDQTELLTEMINCEIDAIVIKVAALGLEPSRHLGRSIRLLEPHLLAMKEKYGLNVCGEGGEYESLTLDCPLYRSRIIIEESETIVHSDDAIAPVSYLKLNKLRLELKLPQLDLIGRFANLPIKDSDGYVTDEEAVEATEITEGNDDTILSKPTVVNNENTKLHSFTTKSAKSNDGWVWLSNITGDSDDPFIAIKQAMEKLKSSLANQNHRLQDICCISMYISDMADFAGLNKIYLDTLSHVNPPTRACVQVPLPKNCPIILETISWSLPDCNGDVPIDRNTIHVQSFSHWAPANIGPYSQSSRVNDLIYLAGQISLVPGSMVLVKGGIKQQCQLSLRHVGRLLKATNPNSDIGDVVQGVCYLSDVKYVETARKMWEEKTNNSLMDYVVATGLPRGSLVEWHVWAHRHNHQFEFEETGQCINDWSISIYRRWTYENNIAAIVCHVANNTEPTSIITGAIFTEAANFTLLKLQQGHVDTACNTAKSICALKIFYAVNKVIPLEEFTAILDGIIAADEINAVFVFVPVTSLHNDSTHLSIVGVRLQ